MTEEFILKRIKEQKDYIEDIMQKSIDGRIDISRSLEVIPSAVGQLEYFTQKLKEMNKTPLQKVTDFMELFNQRIGKKDELEPLENRQLGIKLMFEEGCKELAEATDVKRTLYNLCKEYVEEMEFTEYDIDGGGNKIFILTDGNNVNKKEQLDSFVDNLYILLGGVNSSGLHEVFEEGFNLIHDNNMTKAHKDKDHCLDTIENLKKTGEQSRWGLNEKDGKFLLYNPDGKLTKPWDHKKVDLSHLV